MTEAAVSVRVCFVGPLIGRTPGRVTTQGEVVVDLLTQDGWQVRETSRHSNRLLRAVDTLSCLVRWHRSVDVVVLSVFSGPAFALADVTSVACRLLRLPIIMWLHGGNLPAFETRHPAWVERVLKRGRLVVAPSSYLRDEVRTIRDRAEIIPNVFAFDSAGARTRRAAQPRLLWMRTFHPLYNPMMAIEVIDELHRAWPEVVLTMAGQDKGLLADVERAVVERGLTNIVRFGGFLNAEAKRAAFDEHDIYLHTNHVDNTPVSVLEAAAAGLPIVGTRVGGLPHLLVEGESGILVDDGDASAMATAVNRLLSDEELCERLSTGGQALADLSRWDVVRDLWHDAFKRSLRN